MGSKFIGQIKFLDKAKTKTIENVPASPSNKNFEISVMNIRFR